MERVAFSVVMVLLCVSLVAAAPSLNAPSQVNFGEIYHNQTHKVAIDVKNAGSSALTNLVFSTSTSADYQVSFSPSSIDSLAPGETKKVDVTLFADFSADVGDNQSIGSINVDSGQGSATLSSLTADIRSYLRLGAVRLVSAGFRNTLGENGGKFEDYVRPGDTFQIEVEVENLLPSKLNADEEINDVEVQVTILEIDDEEDLEFESESFDLDFQGNDKKHTFVFESTIPLQSDHGDYTIEIEISAEDAFKNSIFIPWKGELTINKDPHDLKIMSLAAPKNVACGESLTLGIGIMNAGRNDENYVTYTILSPELGINIRQARFELDSNIDNDENILRKTHPVVLQKPAAGTYKLTASVYRDGDILEDISALNITTNGCGTGVVVPTPPVMVQPPETPIVEPETSVETPQTPGEEAPQDEESQSQAPQPVVGSLVQDTSLTPIFLALLLAIAISFGILVILKLKK